MLPEFRNEPFTDFSLEANRAAFQAALDGVGRKLGGTYDLRIGGESVATRDRIRPRNPCRPDEVIGEVAKGTREHAERAIQAAAAAFPEWSRTDPDARARVLFRAAAIMRRRRHELAAWMVVEVAKTWPEADGDIAEAIDFLEFYGREMQRLAAPQPLVRIPGEDNELYYIPLGAGAVIPPWNFPGAIMAGMTAAAIVAGNTVVLKPASTSPVIAAKFVEIMEEAGTPPGVLNFCPGGGGDIGDHLVDHARTRFIAFTGSKETGLRIHERASKTAPGQSFIKRTILEMGGKDAIVVDEDVDPEEAASGIVAAAFGFQGQKCSACSRAIVHERLYGDVLERIRAKTAALRVGDARDPRTQMSAVVDEKQLAKVLDYIEIGKREGRLVAGGARDPELGPGYFVRPTVFADVPPGARLAREEIFGPVLAVQRASSFEDAIAQANDTEFGLTGAAYSRSRAHLEYARREFHAGNLYLNRKCTGALVGVHPFGGFNMSGTDSKAGGRDYLLLFTQAKVVSEKMLMMSLSRLGLFRAVVAAFAIALTGCGDSIWEKSQDEFQVHEVGIETQAFTPGPSEGWSNRAFMPFPSSAETAVVGASGRIYVVAGGTNVAMRLTPEAGADGTWEFLPVLPEPRGLAEAVAAGNTIAVASGVGGQGPIAFVDVLDDSAPTPQWSRIATPFRRRDAIVVGTADQKLYILGGVDETGIVQSEVWELAPAAPGGTWTQRGNLSAPRALAGGFVLANKVHVVSGHSGNGVALASEDVFDLASAQVVTPNAIPTARFLAQTAVIGDRAFVFDARFFVPFLTGRLDSFREGEGWSARANHPGALFASALGTTAGRLLVAGGFDLGREESQKAAHVYDPTADTWFPSAQLVHPRYGGFVAEIGPRTHYVGGVRAHLEKKKLEWTDFLY